MPVQNRDYYGAMQRGRTDRLDEEAARTRNALGGLELEQGRRFNALAGNPQATPEQFARAGRSDVGNAILNAQGADQRSKQEQAQRFYLGAQYALRSQSPKAFIAQNFPEIAAMNPNFANETDQQIAQSLQDYVGRFGAQAGIAPPAPEPQFEQMQGPNGSTIVRRGDKWQVIEQPKPERSPARFRPMATQEIQAAGLPPGTAAQINDETGQISILSKRDNTASLSQKDQTTAKQKLVTVQLARQQLENIKKRFANLRDSMSAGAFGQGTLPTESGKSFDAAVDQMRSTLTALTRTPGVGAMSDYETRLDQAKFPSRRNYESVTAEQIQAIEDQLTLIDRGYRGLLEGAAPEGSAQQPTASAAPAGGEVTATGPNGQKIVLRNGQWVPL